MAEWEGTHDAIALAATLRGPIAAAVKAPAGALSEKRMFGGICFLLNGNMLCGAGKNGYMFRVDRARSEEAERLPGGRPTMMQGRTMPGFYWVDPAACDSAALGRWIALAADYVGKMPAKPEKRKRDRSA